MNKIIIVFFAMCLFSCNESDGVLTSMSAEKIKDTETVSMRNEMIADTNVYKIVSEGEGVFIYKNNQLEYELIDKDRYYSLRSHGLSNIIVFSLVILFLLVVLKFAD